MAFDMNPADEDEHGECRHEIERLNAEVDRLTAMLLLCSSHTGNICDHPDHVPEVIRLRTEGKERAAAATERVLKYLQRREGEANIRISELEDVLRSARAICQREGADTAWKRFDERIANLGIGSVTAKVFKVLPSDIDQHDDGSEQRK